MPDARLAKARATLPVGYQFGDARYTPSQRKRYPLATNARHYLTGRKSFGASLGPVYVYDGTLDTFVAVPRA